MDIFRRSVRKPSRNIRRRDFNLIGIRILLWADKRIGGIRTNEKLNELGDGSCGTIVAITGDSHFQSRITSIGLTIGSRIEVIQNPKKQPVLLYNRDTMVALNKNEAEKIMVEVRQ